MAESKFLDSLDFEIDKFFSLFDDIIAANMHVHFRIRSNNRRFIPTLSGRHLGNKLCQVTPSVIASVSCLFADLITIMVIPNYFEYYARDLNSVN